MNGFIGVRRAAAVAVAATAALWLAGCSKTLKQETAPEAASERYGASSETDGAANEDEAGAPPETADAPFVRYGVFSVSNDSAVYTTVRIGGQTWLAENLNRAPDSGKSWCYNDDKDSCAKYGRLYDWETARTVCPAGWHLPSAAEWDELTGWVKFMAGSNSAKTLVAANVWDKDNSRGNLLGAANEYGFSALPGGLREPDGGFINAGYQGVWWTDTEDGGNRAYQRSIRYDEDTVTAVGVHKKYGGSARCVMDESAGAACTLTLAASDGGTAAAFPRKASYNAGKRVTLAATPKSGYVFDKWSGGQTADSASATTAVIMDSNMTITAHFRPIVYGALSDSRDGRTYKTVKMPDGLAWMAENLNYEPPESAGNAWVYRHNTVYSDKYGRLYDWETAKTACPEGWRLPTRRDWNVLGKAVGGVRELDKRGNVNGRNAGRKREEASVVNWRGAGRKLKAASGWGKYNSKHGENRNGTDDYGFSALPGGYLCGDSCYGGGYFGAGDDHSLSSYESGAWWTASPAPPTSYGYEQAFYRRISYNSASLYEDDDIRSNGHSVRCVANAEGFAAAASPGAYSLTVRAADGGSVSVDPAKASYAAGEKVSISAAPNCGFVFSKWIDGETADPAATSTTVTLNSNMTVTAKFTRVTPYLARGAFTDKRDGKTYKTVQICKYVWMAENLNYKTEDRKCPAEDKSRSKKHGGGVQCEEYGDDCDDEYSHGGKRGGVSDCRKQTSGCYRGKESNCDKYGRLYDWETAKRACPSGWHLATDEDWEELEGYADGWEKEISEWGLGGGRLKTKSGWRTHKGYKEETDGNGTDAFGFAALPGGSDGPEDDLGGGYFDAGKFGGWWTANTPRRGGRDDAGLIRYILYTDNSLNTRPFDKSFGFSVRCVRDEEGRVPPPAALTLKLSAAAGGAVSANLKKASYVAGERVIITAVPNRGYTFAKWTGGKVADTASAVTVVTISSNMTITANFNKSKTPPPAYGALTDARDGKKYETVSIGGKLWMAQNLNYQTPDSSWCYGDSAANCNKYGRLYAWNAAKTACPAGWHLPSDEEWNGLIKAAGGEKAAVKLKAASGWVFFGNGWMRSGDGSDDYGFAARSGGYVHNGKFYYVGQQGYWWTSSEDEREEGDAQYRKMEYNDADVSWGGYGEGEKSRGYSVRCVVDEPAPYKLTLTASAGGTASAKPVKASYKTGEQVTVSAVPDNGYVFDKWSGGKTANAAHAITTVKMDSSMTIAANFKKSAAPQAAYGTLADDRDGKKYKTVTIGGKTWMAENLNYQTPDNSRCYGDKAAGCAKYGRLYSWWKIQDACPAGWHLPTRDEWKALVDAAGGAKAADKALKSVSGWNRAGNGTDDFGFAALPGGSYDDNDIKYEDAGDEGLWWTSTKEERKSDIGAYAWSMNADSGKALENTYFKRDGLSVRCVMDADGAITVAAKPGGTAAANPSKASYKAGERITISARPNSGHAFAGWSGGLVADVDAETTEVVVNAAMTITAKFRNLSPETLIDKRDGKTYKTVKIGRDRWTAENINYKANGSRCYNDDDAYCAKYGRLYDWNAANKACPRGWHLPTREEWDTLAATAGGWHYIRRSNREDGITWNEAARRLKAKSGWDEWDDARNTDNVGFSALPAGHRYRNDDYETKGKYQYGGENHSAYWWSSGRAKGNKAFYRNIGRIASSLLEESTGEKSDGYSVRCVKDKDD